MLLSLFKFLLNPFSTIVIVMEDNIPLGLILYRWPSTVWLMLKKPTFDVMY